MFQIKVVEKSECRVGSQCEDW